MNPLNPELYESLRRAFGRVEFSHQGESMVAVYTPRPGGGVQKRAVWPGEYYRVSCPYCTDTRQRLWINHCWGVRDARTGTRHRWMAYCYNENCLKDEDNRLDLIARTSWYHRCAGAGRVSVAAGATASPAGQPVSLPGDFVRLDALPRGHIARRFVRRRGFSPDALARLRGVGFSRDAFRLAAAGRLVVPVYRLEDGRGRCWGWQARALDIRDEARGKYFTSTGMKKSHLLYGLESAVRGDGPVLVCEGVTDVWSAGKNSVALMGKIASAEQLALIRRHLRGRPLVVALDGDAGEESRRLRAAILEARAGSLRQDAAPVARLRLPAGRDPGDTDREDLWRLARRALERLVS